MSGPESRAAGLILLREALAAQALDQDTYSQGAWAHLLPSEV